MKIGCIYVIKNKINNKVYIGQTTQGIENRWKQHIKPSEYKQRKYKIYKAINKYGVENFYYEVLEDNIPYNKLDEKEIYYIEKFDSFNNGYNSSKGGDGKSVNKLKDVNAIILRLKNGDSIENICKDYDVCSFTIKRTLNSIGIKGIRQLRPKNFTKGKNIKIDRKKVIDLYKLGMTYDDISKKLNIHNGTVGRILRENNIREKNMIDYKKIDKKAIMDDINNLVPKKDILSKYKLNQNSFKVLFGKDFVYNDYISSKKPIVTKEFLLENINLPTWKLAEITNTNKGHIYKKFKEFGIIRGVGFNNKNKPQNKPKNV